MRAFLNACLMLLCVTFIYAQNSASKDPVSGVWGEPDGAGFDLKFDGKHAVSGTIRIVHETAKSIVPIKTGTFDSETGALKLEGEAQGPDGTLIPFVIEGKIAEDKVTGTYRFSEDARGEFTFTRVKRERVSGLRFSAFQAVSSARLAPTHCTRLHKIQQTCRTPAYVINT